MTSDCINSDLVYSKKKSIIFTDTTFIITVGEKVSFVKVILDVKL